MFDGPQDELTLTANAQPALMAVSMAVMRALDTEGGMTVKSAASHIAGHSLGEYSALAAAGTLNAGNAAELLKTRGQAMQEAVSVGDGAMAAVLGLDLDVVEDVAIEAAQVGECAVANDNAPGQVVLSGDSAAIDRAMAIAKDKGARRSIKLAVSAPFHCALMAPAAQVMKDALDEAPLTPPVVPLVANVTAATVTDAEEIKSLLVAQVTARVQWRKSILAMVDAGVTQFVEIGAGKVLTGLNRRIAKDAQAVNISTPDELEAFLKSS